MFMCSNNTVICIFLSSSEDPLVTDTIVINAASPYELCLKKPKLMQKGQNGHKFPVNLNILYCPRLNRLFLLEEPFLSHFPLEPATVDVNNHSKHLALWALEPIKTHRGTMISSILLCNQVMYLCAVPPSGFSQSGVGGTLGSSLSPFQTSMSSGLGQMGMGPALDTQKSSGLFGVENKIPGSMTVSSAVRTSDVVSSGGPGIHSQDHSAGIKSGCALPPCPLSIYHLDVL